MSFRRWALLPLLALSVLLRASARSEPQAVLKGQGLQERPQPAVDVYGDPLPSWASVRLGTLRWRHGSLITASAFARDGMLLATGGPDGTVCLWESATGKKLRQFQGLQSEVSALVFSPDGKSLSAAERVGGAVRTWETATGKELRHVPGYPNDDCCVAFSADGKILAAGNSAKDSTIRLRETTGQHLRDLKGHQGVIYALALSPDGKLLASGGDDKVLRLWDTTTGKEVHAFAGHAQRIRCTRFSPDGKRIASASDDGTVRLWDVASRKELHQLAADPQGAITLAFSPDGATLISGGRDHVLRLWDVASGKELRRLQGHHDSILTTAFSPDGTLVASGGIGGRVRIWDATTGTELSRDGHQAGVHALVYAPDGKTLFTGGFDNSLRRWDPATGKELRRLDVLPEGASCMALSPDGNILASGTWSNREGTQDAGIRLWDAATGKELRRLKGHPKGVFCLAFSPCGKVLASGGHGEVTVLLWDVATGRQLRRLQTGEGGGVRGLAFSPNGQSLASGGADRTLRLWETASGKVRGSFSPMDLSDHSYRFNVILFNEEKPRESFSRGHPPLVESILFFPDGKTVATAGANEGGGGNRRRVINIWDTTTDKELRWLVGPERRPAALPAALSPDGRILALGADNGAVQLRDAVTGKELCVFRGHEGGVYALGFSPDGKTLASSSSDATVLIWDVAGALQARRPASQEMLDRQLQAVWSALADEDGATAAKAVWQMTETPEATVRFLKARLQPIAPVDAKRIAQWIVDLGDERYRVRQQAMDALQELDQALSALHQTLGGNLSLEISRRVEQILAKLEQSPPSSYLRALRAVEVLGHIGTPEACEALATLSRGAPAARLTQAAQQAHQRLAKKSAR